jgi:hypothetical protein
VLNLLIGGKISLTGEQFARLMRAYFAEIEVRFT